MEIWSSEIKELERLYESLKGLSPDLKKELERLIRADDENMILLYSRRCLEVIITDLCECELKRQRKTEPLKGIIDKLHKEGKISPHIIASMHGLNELSTFGTHPKDFDPEQTKPVLVNLDIIIKWYLKYKGLQRVGKPEPEEKKYEIRQQTSSPLEKSIIVLPFENMSSDPEQEYFSDGLTEEIITDLSYIHDLLVISRNSAITFKGTKKKTGEIAKEVNVRYVLEGSVRKAGNNLRIIAQLIDSLTDTHLWAEKYNGTLDDVFDIQEKVSQSIAKALKIKLRVQETDRIKERPINNVLAYDCYIRAYYEVMSFSLERLKLAVNLLQKGLDIVGENAPIYAGLAWVYTQYANLGIDQEENLKYAEEWVTKAIKLNPESPEANTVLGFIYLTFKGEPHKAIHYFQKANSIKPDDPNILVNLAWGCITIGKIDYAKSLLDRAIKIDPINPNFHFMIECALFFNGQFDLALNPILDICNLSPNLSMMQYWKSLILLYCNAPSNTLNFLNEVIKEPGQDILTQLLVFLKYILIGDKEKINSLLTKDFIKHAQIDCQLSWNMATFYSLINEKDKSLEWLENGVNRGFINYPFLNEYDKLLNNIRGEERFKKLMERVKYEWENFEL